MPQQVPLTLRYELLAPGGADPDAHVKPTAPELQPKKFQLYEGKCQLFRPTPAMNLSPLEALRLTYKTDVPAVLKVLPLPYGHLISTPLFGGPTAEITSHT